MEKLIFKGLISNILPLQNGNTSLRIFNKEVLHSLPFKAEVQQMIAQLTEDFAEEGTQVYDLGCATGETLENLHQKLDSHIGLIGVEDSLDLLRICKENLDFHSSSRNVSLLHENFTRGIHLENATVVILFLSINTLCQTGRIKLFKNICSQLPKQGALIFVDKSKEEGDDFGYRHLPVKYSFKFANPSSYLQNDFVKSTEKKQKFIEPLQINKTEQLLTDAGFKSVELFFRWDNFSGYIAVK